MGTDLGLEGGQDALNPRGVQETEGIPDRRKNLSQVQRHDCKVCLLVDILDRNRGD